IDDGAAGGGAVAVGGPLRVETSYFIGNLANGRSVVGGAIRAALALPSLLEISDSAFVGNRAVPDAVPSAYGAAGALSINCTTCVVRIERNFFGDNRAQEGGALVVRGNDGTDAAQLTLHNATFTGNQAETLAGALLTVGSRMDV